MSYDPEDEEGPPPAEPNREPVKVEIELSFGEVLDRITDGVIHRFLDGDRWDRKEGKLDAVIERIAAKTIHPIIKKLVDERAGAIVDQALETGWAQPGYSDVFDSGTAEGQRVTVRSLMRKVLETKTRKNYDSPEQSWIEVRVNAYLEHVVNKALAEELAEARKRFRAAVDKLIEQNALAAVRAALKGE